MAQDGISTVLLRYEIDRQSLNQASLASIRIRSDLQFIAQQAKQVDLATHKVGDSIRDAFGSKSSSTIKSLVGPTEDATKQMNRLKESVTGVQQEIKKLSSIKAADIVDPELGDVVGGGGGGGIRGAQATFRRLGAQGRSLPSIQIPGAGIGTDALSNILRLAGSVPPIFLAGAAAVAVMGAGVVALNVILGDSKAQLDAATKANTTYYDLIRNKTTSGELQEQITTLAESLAVDMAELDSINKAFDSGFKSVENIVGNSQAKALFALGQISNADDVLTARADELRKTTGENSVSLGVLMDAQDSAVIAANDLAAATIAAKKAEEELAAVRASNSVRLDQVRIQSQIEATNLAANGTEKQVQDRLEALAREKAVLQANLPIMQANLATTTEGTKAYEAYKNQLDSTTLRLAELDTTMLTLAGDTLQAVKANDLAAEAEKKRIDSIAAVTKYNADITKINEDEAAKQADLAQKYADKQVDIAAKAVEDAQRLLENLEQKLAGLATDVNRDLDKDARKANFDALQDQIEFQRDEVAATQEHYQDLERIRRQALAKEFEQGLDRDFAGLAASRRATAEQVNESNIQFNQDRAARLAAFEAKRSDDAAEFEFERQERIIKFEQDIADARAQYIRERQQLADAKTKQLLAAKAAYDKELSMVNSKYRAELAARDAAIRAELQQIQAGNQARLQLETQLQQQYLTILRNAANSVGIGLASGASGAGFSSLPGGTGGVQVSGNATGTGLGGLFGFGSSQQNTTARNGSNMSINMPITITTGASQSQVAAIVPAIRKEVDTAITTYHRQIYGR